MVGGPVHALVLARCSPLPRIDVHATQLVGGPASTGSPRLQSPTGRARAALGNQAPELQLAAAMPPAAQRLVPAPSRPPPPPTLAASLRDEPWAGQAGCGATAIPLTSTSGATSFGRRAVRDVEDGCTSTSGQHTQEHTVTLRPIQAPGQAPRERARLAAGRTPPVALSCQNNP